MQIAALACTDDTIRNSLRMAEATTLSVQDGILLTFMIVIALSISLALLRMIWSAINNPVVIAICIGGIGVILHFVQLPELDPAQQGSAQHEQPSITPEPESSTRPEG
jgi:hypothetical protein